MVQQQSPLTVSEARELLGKAELRRTSCRVAVLQHLSLASTPQNHAEVAEALVPAGYDKSTIYRCLVEMTNAGLLRRFELGDHVWRFAVNWGQHTSKFDHPHFVCVDCGNVSCLSDAQVRISAGKGEKALDLTELTDVVLHGRCVGCRTTRDSR